jgi:SepF-like predicted cell division protein (DUF552 family)
MHKMFIASKSSQRHLCRRYMALKKMNKRKYILSIGLIILITISCNQEKYQEVENKEAKTIVRVPPPPLKYYVDFNSIKCKEQLVEAKKQVEKGNLVYQISSNYISRYDEEFEVLLANNGIGYINYGPNCTLGQECFGYYMDSIIHKRFGNDFISQIEKQADSLYLLKALKSYAVLYWDCDKKPINKSRSISESEGIYLKVPYQVKFNKRTWKTTAGDEMWAIDRPFMDISFIINKDGSLSNFELKEFVYVLNENQKLENELLEFAIQKIKSDYNDWIPGIIDGQIVNTKYILRVNFKDENDI